MPSSRPSAPARWLATATATIVAALLIGAAGLPTPVLFGALAVGIANALVVRGQALTIAASVTTLAQALIGVSLGSEMQATTLRAVATDWFCVSVAVLGTLAVSLAAGIAFAALTGTSRRTGMLGLVAGGASAIIAMADEVGADGRLVAFMQYLRVLVVVLLAPLVAFLFLHDAGGPPLVPEVRGSDVTSDLLFTAACVLAGTLVARFFRITAGSLLGPLIVAAVFSVSGVVGEAGVPVFLEYVAFAVIGLQVGLRFTLATIIEARRLLRLVILAIFVLIAACSGLAVLLVPLADVTFADAYLATTPGGLYAVLAASIGLGADTTFVVSVQVLRVFVIVLAAPTLIRVLTRNEPWQAGQRAVDGA